MTKSANTDRAEALRALGYQAFRAGRVRRAQQLFERALAAGGEAHPEAATLLSDLGVAASSLGDDAAARAYHERALGKRRAALGPGHVDVAASLHNLGVVCRKLGDLPAAAAFHREGLAIWRQALGPAHPAVARGLAALGAVASRAGDWATALQCHRHALRVREAEVPPQVADIAASLDDTADALAALGDAAGAQGHWQRAADLLRSRAGGSRAMLAAILNKQGVAARRLGDAEGAAACFASAVQADPDCLPARHNLAVALARLGRHAEAARHRDLALQRQCVFVQEAAAETRRVLILAGSDIGNVPLEHLLPESSVTRIWWFIGHADERLDAALPDYDAVFNGAGDPDLADAAAARTAAFLRRCRKPVLNRPERVLMTRRDRLASLLADVPGVLLPRLLRLDAAVGSAALRRRIEAAGLAPPLLLRPPGSHGGTGVIRLDDWGGLDGVAAQVTAGWYAGEFVDCRAADGFVRKYRVAYVDREPFPYHLAISPHWMVHYFSADMAGHAWKLAEEAGFLADWRGAVGAAAAEAIAAIGRRLDLDFCGIDFGMAADGRPVVFEANATMLIHPEAAGSALAFKNPAVERIIHAMQALLMRHAG